MSKLSSNYKLSIFQQITQHALSHRDINLIGSAIIEQTGTKESYYYIPSTIFEVQDQSQAAKIICNIQTKRCVGIIYHAATCYVYLTNYENANLQITYYKIQGPDNPHENIISLFKQNQAFKHHADTLMVQRDDLMIQSGEHPLVIFYALKTIVNSDILSPSETTHQHWDKILELYLIGLTSNLIQEFTEKKLSDSHWNEIHSIQQNFKSFYKDITLEISTVITQEKRYAYILKSPDLDETLNLAIIKLLKLSLSDFKYLKDDKLLIIFPDLVDHNKNKTEWYINYCKNKSLNLEPNPNERIEIFQKILLTTLPISSKQFNLLERLAHNILKGTINKNELVLKLLDKSKTFSDDDVGTVEILLRCGLDPNLMQGESNIILAKLTHKIQKVIYEEASSEQAIINKNLTITNLHKILDLYIDYGLNLSQASSVINQLSTQQATLSVAQRAAIEYSNQVVEKFDKKLKQEFTAETSKVSLDIVGKMNELRQDIVKRFEEIEVKYDAEMNALDVNLAAFNNKLQRIPDAWWAKCDNEKVNESIIKSCVARQLLLHKTAGYLNQLEQEVLTKHYTNIYENFYKFLKSQLRIAVHGITAAASDLMQFKNSQSTFAEVIKKVPYVGELISSGITIFKNKQDVIKFNEKAKHFFDNQQEDRILADFATKVMEFCQLEIPYGNFAKEEDEVINTLKLFRLPLTLKSIKDLAQISDGKALTSQLGQMLSKPYPTKLLENFLIKRRTENDLKSHWEKIATKYVSAFIKYLQDTSTSYADGDLLGQKAAAEIIPSWFYLIDNEINLNINSKGFDINNAVTLAEITNLMYAPKEMLNYILKQLWHKEGEIKIFERSNLRVAIVADDTKIIIAYRGTDNLTNWVRSNLDYGRVGFATESLKLNDQEIHIHKGFYNAVLTLWDDPTHSDGEINSIQEFIKKHIEKNPNVKIFSTGHSLGAAMASITTLKLLEMGIPHENLTAYTFAQPRCYKNTTVNEVFENTYRIVGHEDIVPNVSCEALGYSHLGNEYNITSSEAAIKVSSPTKSGLGRIVKKNVGHIVSNVPYLITSDVTQWTEEYALRPTLAAHDMNSHVATLKHFSEKFRTGLNILDIDLQLQPAFSKQTNSLSITTSPQIHNLTTQVPIVKDLTQFIVQVPKDNLPIPQDNFLNHISGLSSLPCHKLLNIESVTGGNWLGTVTVIPPDYSALVVRPISSNNILFKKFKVQIKIIDTIQKHIKNKIKECIKINDKFISSNTQQDLQYFYILEFLKSQNLISSISFNIIDNLKEKGTIGFVSKLIETYQSLVFRETLYKSYIEKFINYYNQSDTLPAELLHKIYHNVETVKISKSSSERIITLAVEGIPIDTSTEVNMLENAVLKNVLTPSYIQDINEHTIGGHPIRFYGDLSFLYLPRYELYNFAFNNLAKILSCKTELPKTQIVKVIGYDESEYGKIGYYKLRYGEQVQSLADVLKLSGGIYKDFIEMHSFSLIFLTSILTCATNIRFENLASIISKSDNYIKIEEFVPNSSSLFSNEKFFVSNVDGEEITSGIINDLWLLPQMRKGLDNSIIQNFLNISPADLVSQWLFELETKYQNYALMYSYGFNRSDMENLGLEFTLPESAAISLYYSAINIQNILRTSPKITHLSLLKETYPSIGYLYDLKNYRDRALIEAHNFHSLELNANYIVENSTKMNPTKLAEFFISHLNFGEISLETCKVLGLRLSFAQKWVLNNITLEKFKAVFEQYLPPQNLKIKLWIRDSEDVDEILSDHFTVSQRLRGLGIEIERDELIGMEKLNIIESSSKALSTLSTLDPISKIVKLIDKIFIYFDAPRTSQHENEVVKNLKELVNIVKTTEKKLLLPILNEQESFTKFIKLFLENGMLIEVAGAFIKKGVIPIEICQSSDLLHQFINLYDSDKYGDIILELCKQNIVSFYGRDVNAKLAVDIALEKKAYDFAAKMVNLGANFTPSSDEDFLTMSSAHYKLQELLRIIHRVSPSQQIQEKYFEANGKHLANHKYFMLDNSQNICQQICDNYGISIIHLAAAASDIQTFEIACDILQKWLSDKHLSNSILAPLIWNNKVSVWEIAKTVESGDILEKVFWTFSSPQKPINLYDDSGAHTLANNEDNKRISKLCKLVAWPLSISEVIQGIDVCRIQEKGNNLLYELLKKDQQEYDKFNLNKNEEIIWLINYAKANFLDIMRLERVDGSSPLDLAKANGTPNEILEELEAFSNYLSFQQITGDIMDII